MNKEARTFDQGSSNGKPKKLTVDEEGHLSVYKGEWTINAEDVGGGVTVPSFNGGNAQRVRCWMGKILEKNLDPPNTWLWDGHDTRDTFLSGASGTPLAISDIKTGNICAIVFDDGLNVPLSNEQQQKLANRGIKITEKDKNRQLPKLAALADPKKFPEIAPALHLPANFESCYVEPLTTAMLRNSLRLPLGTLGWTNADWRGVTNGKDDSQLTHDVLVDLGYQMSQQFHIQEQSVLELWPGKYVGIGGDFQVNVMALDALCKENNGIINSKHDIFGELDTIFKFFKKWDCEIEAPNLNSTNGSGMYGLNRNGGRAQNYLMQLWKPQLISYGGDFYQYIDDQVGLEMDGIDSNPFIFIPTQTEINPQGTLLQLIDGDYREIDLNSTLQIEDIDLKRQLTAAVYAGLGCETRYMLGDIPSLVLYGGFMQANQVAKRTIFRNCLSQETAVAWLDMPDSGMLTAALFYKKMYGDKIKLSDVVTRKELGNGGTYDNYFQEWLKVRIKI